MLHLTAIVTENLLSSTEITVTNIVSRTPNQATNMGQTRPNKHGTNQAKHTGKLGGKLAKSGQKIYVRKSGKRAPENSPKTLAKNTKMGGITSQAIHFNSILYLPLIYYNSGIYIK